VWGSRWVGGKKFKSIKKKIKRKRKKETGWGAGRK
jgi:hypothetical protein